MLPAPRFLTLQSVPPTVAHLCLDIENFVQKDLGHCLHNKKLLIGFSGGIDSTALLLIFHLLKKRCNLDLAAAHLHHGIRQEAGKDQAFCKKLCEHLGISFYTTCVNVPAMCHNGAGLEDAARTARYNFFASVDSAFPFDYVLTGHHLNDLAEDCFMRLLRGSGWPALAGMSAYVPQRRQLRPLLLQPKKALETFLLKLNIPHVTDATNDEAFTLRNRIRHHILPFFMVENPRFLERIASLWQQGQADEEGINMLLAPIFSSIEQNRLPSSGSHHSHATPNAHDAFPHNAQLYPAKQQETCLKTGHSRPCAPVTAPCEAPSSRPLQNSQNCKLSQQELYPLDGKKETPKEYVKSLSHAGTSPSKSHARHADTVNPKNFSTTISLTHAQLKGLPRSFRLRAYKHALDALGPGQVLSETLQRLDKAWEQQRGRRTFQFPQGKTAEVTKLSIVFKKE